MLDADPTIEATALVSQFDVSHWLGENAYANWLMDGGDTAAQTNPTCLADALVVVVAVADVGTYLPEWGR